MQAAHALSGQQQHVGTCSCWAKSQLYKISVVLVILKTSDFVLDFCHVVNCSNILTSQLCCKVMNLGFIFFLGFIFLNNFLTGISTMKMISQMSFGDLLNYMYCFVFILIVFLPIACKGSVAPESRGGKEETQEKTTCAVSKFLFYGCQMSR